MGLLDDIGPMIGEAIDDLLTDMILTRSTPGTYNALTGTSSGVVINSYPCRGIVAAYTNFDRLNTRISENDVRITVTQITLNKEPLAGDLIIVTARNKTYRVIKADSDPANATWDIQATV